MWLNAATEIIIARSLIPFFWIKIWFEIIGTIYLTGN